MPCCTFQSVSVTFLQGGPDDMPDSMNQTEEMPGGGTQDGGDGASRHVTASTPDEFALLKQRTHVRL